MHFSERLPAHLLPVTPVYFFFAFQFIQVYFQIAFANVQDMDFEALWIIKMSIVLFGSSSIQSEKSADTRLMCLLLSLPTLYTRLEFLKYFQI